MWYDTYLNSPLDDVFSFVKEVLDGHFPDELIDESIDECYPMAEFFGVKFLPSRILKELDSTTYDRIRDEEIDYYYQECENELEDHGEPEIEGITLMDILYDVLPFNCEKFKEIEWRKEE